MSSISVIRDRVADFYGVTPSAILAGSGGRREVVEARHVGIHLARERTDASLEAIARRFGRSSHGSALYALDRVARKLDRDPAFEGRVRAIERALDAGERPAPQVGAELGPMTPGSQRTPLREAVKDVLDADDTAAIADTAAAGKAARRKLDAALKRLRAAFENERRAPS